MRDIITCQTYASGFHQLKSAPEICARRGYDARKADVWSLGVLLFAMLCGYFPFQGQTTPELMIKIQRGVFRIPDFVSAGWCCDVDNEFYVSLLAQCKRIN
jgi:serine/threonine protein kinase